MDKMRKCLKKVQETADKYADKKLESLTRDGKKPEDDPYIKRRIDLARAISRFAAEGQKVSAEEKESLASNDRRSMEQFVRLQTPPKEKKEGRTM